jgi:DNA-binding PucR family transcriptional regulator
MPTIEGAVKHLRSLGEPTDIVAMAIWTEEDVLEKAKERGIVLTKEQAEEILDRIDHKQDYSIGISWDTIDVYIDEYVREHAEGKLRFIELLKQTFESSSGLTSQFKHFYEVFRNDFKCFLKGKGVEVWKFNRMHFEVSGFFQAPSGQIYYFCTGDVRLWYGRTQGMLLRTAKSFQDYTGGPNGYVRTDTDENFIRDLVHCFLEES